MGLRLSSSAKRAVPSLGWNPALPPHPYPQFDSQQYFLAHERHPVGLDERRTLFRVIIRASVSVRDSIITRVSNDEGLGQHEV